MRIAIISEVFLPRVDGVVGRTVQLIRELQQRGDEILVVCPAVPETRNSPVPMLEFPSFSCCVYPDYHIGVADQRLIDGLKKFAPDVIHFLNPFAFGFQCADLLRRSTLDFPCLFSFHTQYGEFVKQYPGLRPLSGLLWWIMRQYHNTADLNLTVSESMVADLSQRGFRRLGLWPPAVDTQRFSPNQKNSAMRTRLSGNHPDAPLLLTVSRLAPEKNTGFLAEILDRIPDARLAIVGDGPDRASLERKFARHKVQFSGCLKATELAQAYASADLFVYASETETMGNVVMEAMASGLPVVAADACGVRSLVQHGHNGFLFPPKQAGAAAGFVRQLLTNPRLLETMSAQAVESMVMRSWQTATDVVRQSYQGIMDSGKANGLPPRSLSPAAVLCTKTLVWFFRSLSSSRGLCEGPGSVRATYDPVRSLVESSPPHSPVPGL